MPKLTLHNTNNPELNQATDNKEFTNLMREAQERRAQQEGIPWTPENVANAIIQCRADCKGIPFFRSKYGDRFLVNGNPMVLMVCHRGGDNCPGTFFLNVPENDLDTIKRNTGEWKTFLQKWENQLPRQLRQRIGEALTAEVTA